MKATQKIKITQSQMSVYPDEEQTDFLKSLILPELVCGQCGASGEKGITLHEISLSLLDDILIKGTCKRCKCKVARLMKHDRENQELYDNVMGLWNSVVD